MDCQKLFIISVLMALSNTIGLSQPVDHSRKDEKISIYVPFDVKYIPVEVSEKSDVKELKSKSDDLKPIIILRKKDILDHFDSNKPIKPVSHLATKDKPEDLIVVPLSPLPSNDGAVKLLQSTRSPQLPKDDLVAAASSHIITKRQTQRFPSFRPVVRFSRFSARRNRFNRNHAMVGYLSDRDLFPTVA
ncbi:uncharacterized protein LOC126739324 [Anthonomus grandis grandis]|uniref:uncharacterized protein LOC126739324 n=1 Tax=Anthonomus grandis grandis TaxID=2921223 RepID=UPI002166B832|nr:uncharacterized protein LOC126739324 [Anthonomus grandis grandis]